MDDCEIEKLLADLVSIQNNRASSNLYDDSQIFDEHQSICDITIDISSQYLSKKQNSKLYHLAEQSNLSNKIKALFNGKKLNVTEKRPALHMALRSKTNKMDASINILVDETISAMEQFVLKLKNKTNHLKSITDIVNVGIGGSDLGPRFALQALNKFQDPNFNYHFISDCDPDQIESTLNKLNPAHTLFIICSKSFTTVETIDNLKSILAWSNIKNYSQTHCIAVTAKPELAKQHKIQKIFPIWSWVGGRFSFCSSINLILMIAIGPEKFKQVLSGAAAMDKHFKEAKFKHNLPVTLALIDIFNVNVRKGTNRATLVYGHPLSMLVPYIQQLEMESNGKMRSLQGKQLSYATSEIVWGGLGNQAQHAYFQLLCQGTQFTPCDIICIKSNRYQKLRAHASHVMQTFKKGSEIKTGKIKQDVPFTLISINDITPTTIGTLVALYEHKVFVKSVIWNINPFDQPGVEYAKTLEHHRNLTHQSMDTNNEVISS